ncbi:uncharacterized protein LOC129326461 [Eublepharis macularius]|uniref:Uncharacterized protein LOC129326461 n=1 Tax=Eublepharis macularius TaxID=481883 RepID=A0AA97J401_EUBMA|nr:uncharacterized protein LOC129326461 [Eublepharis macularius]
MSPWRNAILFECLWKGCGVKHLKAAWEGPHAIVDKLDDITCAVAMARSGHKTKVVHVNMLEPLTERPMVLPVTRKEGENAMLDDDPLDVLAHFSEPAQREELGWCTGMSGHDKENTLSELHKFVDMDSHLEHLAEVLEALRQAGLTIKLNKRFHRPDLQEFPNLELATLFIVATDASDREIGAVLMQGWDGTKHPLAYLSRKLIPREKNLSSVQKECRAVVWALDKLRPYLWGQEVSLLTDPSSLQWLQAMKNTHSKLRR